MKNPDPQGSKFQLYLNGQSVKTNPISDLDWGDQQFTLAACKKSGSYQQYFNGILEEIRIWKVCRTQEQLQDNLFTRLKGEKQDLIANYTFDFYSEDETELKDSSLLGNHLQLGTGDTQPSSILSTAPISNDIAQVRSAFSGVETQFHDTIDSSPAVQEYADMQYDADYNLLGIMKRCYSYIKEGQWHLYTGYKVGNLVTEWIGQAQFNPQIIGYLEGTPPVPSENMTYGTQGTGTRTYEGAGSQITFVQADEVMYNYATSKETGYNNSYEGSQYMGGGSEMEIVTAPFGLGTTKTIDIEYKTQRGRTVNASSGWFEEQSMSTGVNISREMSASLGGNWESPNEQGQLNPNVGRRWLSGNSGLALVQSETADIFALRLAHNNALVSLQFQPNPDIPKDWNIIAFPLNPRYTQQGTLDGKVGYKEDGSVCTDPNYPQAATYGEYSYFKPKEAYALKKQIDQEKQELQNYYNNFDASPLSDQNINQGFSKILGGLLPGAGQIAANSSYDDAIRKNQSLGRQFSKRNIANTYVWTADGGFFAETTDTMDIMQDCISGSYSFNSASSFGSSLDIDAFVLNGYEMNNSQGTSLNMTKTKSKEATKTFSIDLAINPSGDMQQYDPVTGLPEYEGYDPILVTGRVDAYRFMTFYLDSSKENFEDLFSKVIDPIWLEQSSHPNAIAMRQANQAEKKPGCWRLMHRVTFVSRVLPEFSLEAEDSLENTMQNLDISSNYELMKQLEPFVKNKTGSYVEFADAVTETIETYLPELIPYTEDIIQYAALYFGVEEEI
ncbi:MAG: LamG-like jellyroll fold domain-containing protein [Crocosphaera sp.]